MAVDRLEEERICGREDVERKEENYEVQDVSMNVYVGKQGDIIC